MNIGYVHTHPYSPQLLPPTPHYDWLDSDVYPVQRMVECGPFRVWGLISPNFAFPLGLMSRSGVLDELAPSAPQARIALSTEIATEFVAFRPRYEARLRNRRLQVRVL